MKEFLDFVQDFKKSHPNLNGIEIETAFLELSQPSIPEALNSLTKKGVSKITAMPYFLFRAGHVKKEIPEMLDEFRMDHPDIQLFYGDSLWPHKNLTELAKRRIHAELEKFPMKKRDQVDLLVVGRGATDLEALSQFKEAVEDLGEGISCRSVQSCFIALAEPKYSELLPQLLEQTDDILIFPYYLFTGILVKRVEMMAEEVKKKNKNAVVRIAPHFGSDPLMIHLLRERIEEISLS